MTDSFVHLDLDSPLGTLRIVARADAIVGVYLPSHANAPELDSRLESQHPLLREAATQIEGYFAGRRRSFDLPLAAEGTAFQREVWAALATIPFGEICSYAELAALVGRPNASRAVGAANGRNPLSIIVPCHRVVGADGSLTGYAGGLEAKRWLLAHEGLQRRLL